MMSIDHSTVERPSDLPLVSCLDANIAKVDDGLPPVFEEGALFLAVGQHLGLGTAVLVDNLVRAEQPVARLQVGVVNVVEFLRGVAICEGHNGGIYALGAHRLEFRCVGCVQCLVHWSVVEAILEVVAVGKSDGMGTCQRSQNGRVSS